MTVNGVYVVVCDECGVTVAVPAKAARQEAAPVVARWWVERWGWRVDDDDRDLCPDHPPGE